MKYMSESDVLAATFIDEHSFGKEDFGNLHSPSPISKVSGPVIEGPLLPACGLPSHAVRLAPAEMQTQRVPGRKRGRPPLHSTRVQMAVHNLYSASAASVPAVTIPKKRGRKPRYKIKSPVLMTPLALSPPRSTPEPDLSSIPQDAATIPSLVVPEALTVCLYINKQADVGPYLERRKLQQLPERLGPERPATVLQQAVQACIDCAHQPRLVFSLVKQGYRGELVSDMAKERPWNNHKVLN